MRVLTLSNCGSQPRTRSCRFLWNSGWLPTLTVCACVLGRSQDECTSDCIKQFSRGIPTLAGCRPMPEGMGTDVWLSLTKDR